MPPKTAAEGALYAYDAPARLAMKAAGLPDPRARCPHLGLHDAQRFTTPRPISSRCAAPRSLRSTPPRGSTPGSMRGALLGVRDRHRYRGDGHGPCTHRRRARHGAPVVPHDSRPRSIATPRDRRRQAASTTRRSAWRSRWVLGITMSSSSTATERAATTTTRASMKRSRRPARRRSASSSSGGPTCRSSPRSAHSTSCSSAPRSRRRASCSLSRTRRSCSTR